MAATVTLVVIAALLRLASPPSGRARARTKRPPRKCRSARKNERTRHVVAAHHGAHAADSRRAEPSGRLARAGPRRRPRARPCRDRRRRRRSSRTARSRTRRRAPRPADSRRRGPALGGQAHPERSRCRGRRKSRKTPLPVRRASAARVAGVDADDAAEVVRCAGRGPRRPRRRGAVAAASLHAAPAPPVGLRRISSMSSSPQRHLPPGAAAGAGSRPRGRSFVPRGRRGSRPAPRSSC